MYTRLKKDNWCFWWRWTRVKLVTTVNLSQLMIKPSLSQRLTKPISVKTCFVHVIHPGLDFSIDVRLSEQALHFVNHVCLEASIVQATFIWLYVGYNWHSSRVNKRRGCRGWSALSPNVYIWLTRTLYFQKLLDAG